MSGSDAESGQFRGAEASVEALASPAVALVDPGATLHEVATKLAAVQVGALVVSTTDEVVGVISERDIVVAVRDGRDLDSTTARDVASTKMVWCPAGSTLGDARDLMLRNHVRHVLVGDGRSPSAILSARDVLLALD